MHVPLALSETLPQCMQTRCADRHTKASVSGLMDCEWCVLENDGKTPLGKPFCSTQRVCFAGVLGATTPYRDEIMGKSHQANSSFHPQGFIMTAMKFSRVLGILGHFEREQKSLLYMQMGDKNLTCY